MKRIHLAMCTAILLLAVSSAGSWAQQNTATANVAATAVPHLVKFTGSVKGLDGKPLTGVAGVTFSLYKDDQGGAPLWLETQNVSLDSSGHYSVMLGATKADGLPADLFTSGEARWLGVQPEGQAEQPRVLLLSVPYALKAGDAATLGGLPPSAFVQTNNPNGQTGAHASASAPAVPTVQGSGTLNFLPIWTGTTTIGNSTLFEKSGKLGIGTTTPAATLDVKGGATIRGNTAITGTLSASTSLTAPSAGFSGNNTSQILSVTQSGAGIGLAATTAATGPTLSALSGTATAISGRAKGVMGTSHSDSGYGVYGFAGGFGTGTSYGVSGISISSLGIGVSGTGAYGVVGSGLKVGGLFQLGGSTGYILQGQNSSGTSVFSVDGRGNLAAAGNGLATFIGDPGCGGSGTTAIGFGNSGLSNCSNYALRGDSGGNLYINSSSTGWMFFDHNNTGSMALDPSGNLSVNGNIGVQGNVHIGAGQGVPSIVATFNQPISGPPGQTYTLYTPSVSGLYRIDLFWVCTQGGNGNVYPSLNLYYTSYVNTQAGETVTSAGTCAVAGGDVNAAFVIWAAAKNPIQVVLFNPPEQTQLILSIEQLM